MDSAFTASGPNSSEESALMSAVRRQMDAFEEKWEKKLLSGDDHYWLTRPAHKAHQSAAHGGDGRPGNTLSRRGHGPV